MSWSDRRSPAAREREAKVYRSKRWRRLRLEKLESVKWKCERCGEVSSRLHVHHRHALEDGGDPYPKKLAALEALCAPCHSRETMFEAHDRRRAARDERDGIHWSEPDEDGRRWGMSAEERQRQK